MADTEPTLEELKTSEGTNELLRQAQVDAKQSDVGDPVTNARGRQAEEASAVADEFANADDEDEEDEDNYSDDDDDYEVDFEDQDDDTDSMPFTTTTTTTPQSNTHDTTTPAAATSAPPPAPATTDASTPPTPPTPPTAPPVSTTTNTAKTDDDAFDDLLGDILGSDLDDLDYSSEDPLEGDLDLNKVDEGTLDQAKKNMNVDFLKNRIRPGDQGYEFDKQVDFAQVDEVESDNSWDDMDESSGDDE